MKNLIAVLFFTSTLPSIAQIDLTQLDGTISEEEKAQFQLLGKNEVSEISMSADGDYLKINIKTDTIFVASLCLCDGNGKTIVMHASSALGQSSYYSKEDDTWNSTESFVWKVRETDMKTETIAKRIDYLEQNGWVANTVMMGQRGEVEFIIKKDLFDGKKVFLGAGLMLKANPQDIIPLPEKTSGDCAAFSLVAGPALKSYQFRPDEWYKIKL